MSERYAREYLCPDPDEHGEVVYVPGLLRMPGVLRPTPMRWEPLREIPTCPICGAEMVHDTDARCVSDDPPRNRP